MEPFTDQQACQCHPMNLYDQNHLDPRCPFYEDKDDNPVLTMGGWSCCGSTNPAEHKLDCHRRKGKGLRLRATATPEGVTDCVHVPVGLCNDCMVRAQVAADEVYDGNLHEQPDDSYHREATRLRATIEDPIRAGSVAQGLHALGQLVDMYETLSRGIIRERVARREAERKLSEIKRTLDADQ